MNKELENMDASVALLRHIENHIDILYNFLLSCGIKPKDKQLSTLTEALKDVKALKPKVNYIAYQTNNDGYVDKAIDMETFTEITQVPQDILRGYYKVDDKGNLVIDYARKNVLWGD
jgi:hypothetical protein